MFWSAQLVFLAAQLLAILLLIRRAGVVVPIGYGAASTLAGIVVPLVAALSLRFVLRLAAGDTARRAASRVFDQWWELPLVVLAYYLLAEAYMWGKVFVPGINPRVWDPLLARIDRALFLGVNPNVALLTIFEDGPRLAASLLDRFYGAFVPAMLGITAWFSTDRPSRRRGFFLGLSITWSLGLWMYLALPARGPIYADMGLWREAAAVFPIAGRMQRELLLNYRNVLAVLHGGNDAVAPTLGIAALPSLHVAAQALFFVWCWKLRSRWRTVFLITTGLTFMGSVATGWHWAVDGFAGLAIAVIAGLAGWALTSRWERAGSDPAPRLMAEPTPGATALGKRPEGNVTDREERYPRGQSDTACSDSPQ